MEPLFGHFETITALRKKRLNSFPVTNFNVL